MFGERAWYQGERFLSQFQRKFKGWDPKLFSPVGCSWKSWPCSALQSGDHTAIYVHNHYLPGWHSLAFYSIISDLVIPESLANLLNF